MQFSPHPPETGSHRRPRLAHASASTPPLTAVGGWRIDPSAVHAAADASQSARRGLVRRHGGCPVNTRDHVRQAPRDARGQSPPDHLAVGQALLRRLVAVLSTTGPAPLKRAPLNAASASCFSRS